MFLADLRSILTGIPLPQTQMADKQEGSTKHKGLISPSIILGNSRFLGGTGKNMKG